MEVLFEKYYLIWDITYPPLGKKTHYLLSKINLQKGQANAASFVGTNVFPPLGGQDIINV